MNVGNWKIAEREARTHGQEGEESEGEKERARELCLSLVVG